MIKALLYTVKTETVHEGPQYFPEIFIPSHNLIVYYYMGLNISKSDKPRNVVGGPMVKFTEAQLNDPNMKEIIEHVKNEEEPLRTVNTKEILIDELFVRDLETIMKFDEFKRKVVQKFDAYIK